jgi:type II restriction enzyme
MRRITGDNLATFIDQLPKNRDYSYINSRVNKGLIRIVDVKRPDGPIVIKRWNPVKGESFENAKLETISSEMMWRVANAFFENEPINIDRVLGGSYNTRSVLESLIAHTPQFYYCYPGRIMDVAGRTKIEAGHKHILWYPNPPHENGMLKEKKVDMVISEIPSSSAVYESLSVPTALQDHMSEEVARRHTQIQVALYLIGQQLGFRTWIARNDRGIKFREKPLSEHEGVVPSLWEEGLIGNLKGAVDASSFIDCIWFKNGNKMPAIMEVEHTTGITSGLTRMLNLHEKIPAIKTRYVIVAPDDDRRKVRDEASKSMFKDLETRYFPYSAVEELLVLCQKRKLRGVNEEFLDCYMEKVASI